MPPPCSIGAGLRPHGRQGRLRAMKLTVNGQERVLEGVDPDMPLLWGIRDLLGSQRNEIRLWKGALRRVHRALGWPACPLVSDISCRRRGWQGHDDRSDLRTRGGSGQVSLDQEQCPPVWLLPVGSDHVCGSVARVQPEALA